MTEKVKVSLGSDDYVYKLDNPHMAHHIKRHNNPYEWQMLKYIKMTYRRMDGCILDIGAHQGNHTLYFAKFCANHVHAMEPHKESFELMEENLEYNNLDAVVTTWNIAVSDQSDGSLLTSSSSDTNIPNPCWRTVDGQKIDLDDEEDIDDDLEQVRSDTLDNIKTSLNKVKLVKIDTEGSEPEIIRGGERFFRDHQPAVFIEVSENTQEIDYLMAQLNYSRNKVFRDGANRAEYLHESQFPYKF